MSTIELLTKYFSHLQNMMMIVLETLEYSDFWRILDSLILPIYYRLRHFCTNFWKMTFSLSFLKTSFLGNDVFTLISGFLDFWIS